MSLQSAWSVPKPPLPGQKSRLSSQGPTCGHRPGNVPAREPDLGAFLSTALSLLGANGPLCDLCVTMPAGFPAAPLPQAHRGLAKTLILIPESFKCTDISSPLPLKGSLGVVPPTRDTNINNESRVSPLLSVLSGEWGGKRQGLPAGPLSPLPGRGNCLHASSPRSHVGIQSRLGPESTKNPCNSTTTRSS